MKNLEILTTTEKEMLLKFPAYISLLAINRIGETGKMEKKNAIEFSHVKTYTCHPLLAEFYALADRIFEKNLIQLDNELPKGKQEREAAIEKELAKLEGILLKLNREYADIMHKSMKTFKEHVSKAHQNILESFIFPVPIKGIID